MRGYTLAPRLGTLEGIPPRSLRGQRPWERNVAVSKKRDKNVYKAPRDIGKPPSENPKWLLPTIGVLLVVGPLWIIVYYVTQANYPLPIGNYNLLVGFAFMIAAMLLLTKWK